MTSMDYTPETDTVFDALRTEDQDLLINRLQFRLACIKLANANGSGDGVRKKIFESIRQLTEDKNGTGR